MGKQKPIFIGQFADNAAKEDVQNQVNAPRSEYDTNNPEFWSDKEDFGESQYDTQLLRNTDTPEDIQEHRYQNQSGTDKAGNAFVRTGAGIGLKLVDGIAFTGGMIGNALEGKFDVSEAGENEVSQKLHELEEDVDKALPIYKPTNYNELGFYDKIMNTNGSFFADEVGEAFEFVGSTVASTWLGSGLINAGLKYSKGIQAANNINQIKKSADYLSKASKVFGSTENAALASMKAKNLSIFGESAATVYQKVADATTTALKNNVLTKETALNIFNTAVEAGMEGNQVAKQYLDSVEADINAKHKQALDNLMTQKSSYIDKLQGAVGVTEEDRALARRNIDSDYQNSIDNLLFEQEKEKEQLLISANTEAKIRANNTFILNSVALFGPNMIQTRALLGPLENSRSSVLKYGSNLAEVKNNINKLAPSRLEEFGKSYLKNTPSELGQEVVQKGITDYQLQEYEYDPNRSYFDSAVDQVSGTVSKSLKGIPTQETAETALITALITAPTSVIESGHKVKAIQGEKEALSTMLENADKIYVNYDSDIKSVYQTDKEGKILKGEDGKELLDQDTINRKVFGQVADFATALETSDAILNNDETRLNLIRSRSLAAMSYNYASMGEEGKDLAILTLDQKATEATQAGNKKEAQFIQGHRKQVEAFVEAYNKIEKFEGNSADLGVSNEDKAFHLKYKKSLYHQAATRLSLQNAIEANNIKLNDVISVAGEEAANVKELQKENESLGNTLKQSFQVSNSIRSNYDKIKKDYLKKVNSSIKLTKQLDKIQEDNNTLIAEKSTATPERALEIDTVIESNNNKALGINQILNQNSRHSGIYESEKLQGIVKQPFSNIEETGSEFDYSAKTLDRTRFIDNKYKLLQSKYNDSKNNGLVEKTKLYEQQLSDLDNKLIAEEDNSRVLQDQRDVLAEQVANIEALALSDEEKEGLKANLQEAEIKLQESVDTLNNLSESKRVKQDQIVELKGYNPRDKKTFIDYEDLRELAEDYQNKNTKNGDNLNIRNNIQSVVEDWGTILPSNPIDDYNQLLKSIVSTEITEDEILKASKNILSLFKDFGDFVDSSYPLDEIEAFTKGFEDIASLVADINNLIKYTLKSKASSKYNVSSDKTEDLFIQLDHEQILDLTEDYASKAINTNGNPNKDFQDVAALLPLKENIIASIEALKSDYRKNLVSSADYSGEKGISNRLNTALKTVNNLISIAESNKANRELRQKEIKRDYSQRQIQEILQPSSMLEEVLRRYLPNYNEILSSSSEDGLNVLLNKVRTGNSEFKKAFKEAINFHRASNNELLGQFLVGNGNPRMDYLKDIFKTEASELANFRYSWEFQNYANALKVNNDEIKQFVGLLRNEETLDILEKSTDTNYTFEKSLAEELSVVEASNFAPSEEQLISIRELLMFLESSKDIAFQQGSAGTGKTSVVLPTVLKVAKKTGIYTSDSEIYAFGHTNRTTEGVFKASNGIKGSAKEFLEMAPEEFNSYNIVIIDEFPILDFDAFTGKIKAIQSYRRANSKTPLKVITLGDYNQNLEDTYTPLLDLTIKKEINMINPLTIKYRSNNEAINGLSDFFETSRKKINKVSGTATGPIGTPGIEGTAVTNNIQDLFRQISTDAATTSKVVIIASFDQDEISNYKKLVNGANLGIDILSTAEAQGITEERVYTIASSIDSRYNNVSTYTAISRASNFSMLFIPNVEVQNFNNSSDADYLNKIQQERDLQIKDSKNKYAESITQLGDLLDSFGSVAKKQNIPVLKEETYIDEIEVDTKVTEDTEQITQPSSTGIVVTYPQTKRIKSISKGDVVSVFKRDEAYLVVNKDNDIVGYFDTKDIPATMLASLNKGEILSLGVEQASHIDFAYKTDLNDTGNNIILEKIDTFLDGLYQGEERPSTRDILQESNFEIVNSSIDNTQGFKLGTIKLNLVVPGKSNGTLAINFNQITSKDFKGENPVDSKIKTIQDFKDKVVKLNSLLTDKGQYGTSAFATLINTAANNLKVSRIDGKPVVERESVMISEEEFKTTFNSLSLSKSNYFKIPVEEIIRKDLPTIMSLATDIAQGYYGVATAPVNFSKIDAEVKEAQASGELDNYIAGLNSYNKKKFELYRKSVDQYSLDKAGYFTSGGEKVNFDFLDAGQGPIQRSFSTVVLSSINPKNNNGLEYTYQKLVKTRGNREKVQVIALPLITTTPNALVLQANRIASENNVEVDIFTPEQAYTFLKTTDLDPQALNYVEKSYEKVKNKTFQSISLNHINTLLNLYENQDIRIPTSKEDIRNANKSLEAKIELGKKLSSNFIGVIPTKIILRDPRTNMVVSSTVVEEQTTLEEAPEINIPKTINQKENITNLLNNSENFNCD